MSLHTGYTVTRVVDRRKGVACKICEDHEMPVDAYGNRAKVAVFSKGAIARLNPGQFYEQYINACSRDISNDIRFIMGRGDLVPVETDEMRANCLASCPQHLLNSSDPLEVAIQHLMGYLAIASPRLHTEFVEQFQNPNAYSIKETIINEILKDGIYTLIPSDSKHINPDLFIALKEYRPPNKSPVTFKSENGDYVTTVGDCLIGEIYYIVLEKLDNKPMGISGPVKGHHGLPAKQTKSTKHGRPSKEQPNRTFGESEIRSCVSVTPYNQTAMLLDMATNANTQKRLFTEIVTCENPMKIDTIYKEGQELGGRPKAFVQHLTECAGIRFFSPDYEEE